MGTTLEGPEGEPVGRVRDLAPSLEEEYPVVTHVIAGGRWYPWAHVATLDPRPRLRAIEPAPPVRQALLLDRHVLNSQIVDLAGKRIRRVGDVELEEDGGRLRLVAVDVGAAALLGRLGLHRLAGRASLEPIDWRSLHVVSRPAHGLQLDSPASAVHRLSDAELVDRLPPIHAGLARRGSAAPMRPRWRRRFPVRLTSTNSVRAWAWSHDRGSSG